MSSCCNHRLQFIKVRSGSWFQQFEATFYLNLCRNVHIRELSAENFPILTK